MSEDEFTKLFKYMQTEFKSIHEQLDQTASKADIQKALGLLDALAKWQEINDDELLVRGHQLDRLDKWTHELADKIGHTLTT